jgi:uncharacterized membrane protein YhaH (DUF805 family)
VFRFHGRSDRLAFLGLSILGVFLMASGFAVAAAIDFYFWRGSEENRTWLGLMNIALMSPGIWIVLAVSVRRCHDLGWSGWWTVIRIVPLANLVQFLWLLAAPGEPGENRFGAPPPGRRPLQPA